MIFRPFLIALQFLTRLPVRLRGTPDERVIGQSLLYYPLVGLLIGCLLAGIDAALAGSAALVRAALLLAAWVLITGALHLDGLADSADAWLGGYGDRERTLAIMQDPYCGPAGVVTLVVVLIVKFAALASLTGSNHDVDLALVPVLGRAVLPLLFLTTPYVRPGGLGDALARNAPRRAIILMLLVMPIIVLMMVGQKAGWLLLGMGLGFLILRRLMMQRIGGTTGDTAGALVEMTEVTVLVTLALS